MSLTASPERADQEVTGLALKALRDRAGLAQRDIAKPLGISTQAWQKYEAGERRFAPDRVAEVLKVIGASFDDLEIERGRILGVNRLKPPIERRQDFVFDVYTRAKAGALGTEIYDVAEPIRQVDLRQILGPRTRALEIGGDSVSPWGESGELILYDMDRHPRRGHGCVIELNSGETYVKLYEKSDGTTLFVKELFPEERILTFPLKDVAGVYAVRLRGD